MKLRKSYSEYSMKQKRKKGFVTPWAYKEGVFFSPSGKWIARVKDRSQKNLKFTTLSQHETKEDATLAYLNYYKKIIEKKLK